MKAFTFFVLATIISLTACKKDGGNKAPEEINGVWVGDWRSGGSSTINEMTVVFRSNGSARVIYGYTIDTTAAYYKLEGSYTYSAGSVSFTYLEGYDPYLHTGKVSGNAMSGTWGEAPSDTDGGTWQLTRK